MKRQEPEGAGPPSQPVLIEVGADMHSKRRHVLWRAFERSFNAIPKLGELVVDLYSPACVAQHGKVERAQSQQATVNYEFI